MNDELGTDAEMSRLILGDAPERLEAFIRSQSLKETSQLGRWLALASSEGKLRCAKVLVKMGADVNYRNQDGETPLSFACANNRLEMAKFLHLNGADLNAVDNGGGTPLDWALCRSSLEFREWLRAVGGTRNATTPEWEWPPTRPGEQR